MLAGIVFVAAFAAWAGLSCVGGRPWARRSDVLARRGMAATSQPLATAAAVDTLRRGGSAVDAAIAANAVLGVVEPTGCGVGGDLFAIVWDARARSLHGLNASGRSPRGLTLDALRARGLERIPAHGPLPVSVPGCVDGWAELHARWGRLPLSDVLAPAVSYAQDGFPVSEVIAGEWARGATVVRDQPGFAEVFLRGGRPPRRGEVYRNPALARTLACIGAEGRDAFYTGRLATLLAEFCTAAGCALRREDLAAHRSTWVTPLSVAYRGCEVWELPPNGQGLAALQMLNLLGGFDVRALGHSSADYLHLLIEAKKLAFADRARCYADPDFAPADYTWLLSAEYADERRRLIDPQRAARAVPPGDVSVRHAAGGLGHGDTVCLATADSERSMVSLIQSNYRGFGSGLCPPELGFGLQNRGELFALHPAHPNVYAPGKRPFHTIIPGFVTRGGRPWLAFGLMGGDMQPQGHVQVLCNLLDFGMGLQAAGDAPRCCHSGSATPTGDDMTDGGRVALEAGIGADVRAELSRRGHALEDAPGAFGGFQAVAWDEEADVLCGASESRKDGQAGGY
jgi:gamma-glutamyltranspeptidase/glutathione hydrolase